MELEAVREALRARANAAGVSSLQRFFKTGPGEYAEGDRFIGVSVPNLRAVARESDGLALPKVRVLLRSWIHEERLLALLMLVRRFERGNAAARERVVGMYLEERRFVNNWDLVDSSAPGILGAWLLDRPRDVLYELAGSAVLWDRRIAMLACFAFIRQRDFADAVRIAEKLLNDPHDLMHKAVGWMLREIGKRDERVLERFLDRHARVMPRVALRYAIERLPEERRRWYLGTR